MDEADHEAVPDPILVALARLHEGLPRQEPGSDEATARALSRVPARAPAAVLDIGCGSGRQTAVLRRSLPGMLVAVDVWPAFLAEAARAVPGILPVRASMTALPFADASFDLIWSEGAIFILGFAEGLRRWRRLLRPGGALVVSECCWLVDDPPAQARTFWQEAYPGMGTIAANTARAAGEGFEVLDTLVLPREAWWREYYEPLMERMEQLAPLAQNDEALRGVIAETQREIMVFRHHGSSYGYVFYIMGVGKSG